MQVKSQEVKEIKSEDDIQVVRICVKRVVSLLNFSLTNQTKVVTAASELARNVYEHGKGGKVLVQIISGHDRMGVKMIFSDQGPGIENIQYAMEDGYTTGGGMGLGLGGSKRLTDEFEIESEPGKGTTVSIIKWLDS